jgi:uncharacterized phage-associated protein
MATQDTEQTEAHRRLMVRGKESGMPTNEFPFNPLKAMQAVSYLLDEEQGKLMSYWRLLKLLYLADRKHLKKRGRPIIGGHAVAMDHGPLSSPVYDAITKTKKNPTYQEWGQHFRVKDRIIRMLNHAGNTELSENEIETLRSVSRHFQNRDDDELSSAVHRLKEYITKYAKGTSTLIPLAVIIDAVGCSDAKDDILNDADHAAELSQLFGG